LTLDEILADHVEPLGVPAWQGAMFGHLEDQFTLSEGLPAEADASRATLRLLEPAVA
jgi:muramoyltetrapeptide carboxypeptidase